MIVDNRLEGYPDYEQNVTNESTKAKKKTKIYTKLRELESESTPSPSTSAGIQKKVYEKLETDEEVRKPKETVYEQLKELKKAGIVQDIPSKEEWETLPFEEKQKIVEDVNSKIEKISKSNLEYVNKTLGISLTYDEWARLSVSERNKLIREAIEMEEYKQKESKKEEFIEELEKELGPYETWPESVKKEVTKAFESGQPFEVKISGVGVNTEVLAPKKPAGVEEPEKISTVGELMQYYKTHPETFESVISRDVEIGPFKLPSPTSIFKWADEEKNPVLQFGKTLTQDILFAPAAGLGFGKILYSAKEEAEFLKSAWEVGGVPEFLGIVGGKTIKGAKEFFEVDKPPKALAHSVFMGTPLISPRAWKWGFEYKLKGMEYNPPIELYTKSDYLPSTKQAIVGKTFEGKDVLGAWIESEMVFTDKVSPFRYRYTYEAPLRGRKIVSVIGEKDRVTVVTREEPKFGKSKTMKATFETVEGAEIPMIESRSFDVQYFPAEEVKISTTPFEFVEESPKKTQIVSKSEPQEIVSKSGQVLVELPKTVSKEGGKVSVPISATRLFASELTKARGRAEVFEPIVYPPASGKSVIERAPVFAEEATKGGVFETSAKFTGIEPAFNMNGEFNFIDVGLKTAESVKVSEKTGTPVSIDVPPMIDLGVRVGTREKESVLELTETTTVSEVETSYESPLSDFFSTEGSTRPKRLKLSPFFDESKKRKRKKGKRKRETSDFLEGIAFFPTLAEIEIFEWETGREAGALIAPPAVPYWEAFKETMGFSEIPTAEQILSETKSSRKRKRGKRATKRRKNKNNKKNKSKSNVKTKKKGKKKKRR